MFKIRKFTENDAPMLVEIFREAFADELSRGMPLLTSEQFTESSKRPGVKIYVSEGDEHQVVAFLTMVEGSIEHPAQVHLIAVKGSFQGKGIGKQLVREALEHAKTIERNKVKLFTRPWNTAMQRVCVELGFVPEAYLRKDYLNEDLILYSAFLK